MLDSLKENFLSISSFVTGFETYDLKGTGLGDKYLGLVENKFGPKLLAELIHKWNFISEEVSINQAKVKYGKLIHDDKYNDLVTYLIYLWYTGNSNQDFSSIHTSNAYKEGLMWKAMGTHPMGSYHTGYGSWTYPPNKM